jgi:hypothetical protein
VITRTSEIIMPLFIVVDDKDYDSEDNPILVREKLEVFRMISTRYENVPIWRTYGNIWKTDEAWFSKPHYIINLTKTKL